MTAFVLGSVLASLLLLGSMTVLRTANAKLKTWRIARARRGFQTMSQDSCRVCEKPLRHGDIWELRVHDEIDELVGMGGGTFMAITYCRRHHPTGSIRT